MLLQQRSKRRTNMSDKSISEAMADAVELVAAAGGELVGRTRLQKTAFMLELAGLGSGFPFSYRHYGPYSQELANSAEFALLFGELEEEQRQAAWGGKYSVYSTNIEPKTAAESPKARIIQLAKSANPVELELAATAAFLATEGFEDPWGETANRKPEKVGEGRLGRAKMLYREFSEIETPEAWPKIDD